MLSIVSTLSCDKMVKLYKQLINNKKKKVLELPKIKIFWSSSIGRKKGKKEKRISRSLNSLIIHEKLKKCLNTGEIDKFGYNLLGTWLVCTAPNEEKERVIIKTRKH